jgi:hypothetical protein
MVTAYVLEEMAENLLFHDFILVCVGLGLLARAVAEDSDLHAHEGYAMHLASNACDAAHEAAARYIKTFGKFKTED